MAVLLRAFVVRHLRKYDSLSAPSNVRFRIEGIFILNGSPLPTIVEYNSSNISHFIHVKKCFFSPLPTSLCRSTPEASIPLNPSIEISSLYLERRLESLSFHFRDASGRFEVLSLLLLPLSLSRRAASI